MPVGRRLDRMPAGVAAAPGAAATFDRRTLRLIRGIGRCSRGAGPAVRRFGRAAGGVGNRSAGGTGTGSGNRSAGGTGTGSGRSTFGSASGRGSARRRPGRVTASPFSRGIRNQPGVFALQLLLAQLSPGRHLLAVRSRNLGQRGGQGLERAACLAFTGAGLRGPLALAFAGSCRAVTGNCSAVTGSYSPALQRFICLGIRNLRAGSGGRLGPRTGAIALPPDVPAAARLGLIAHALLITR